jgi:hypothetical protein
MTEKLSVFERKILRKIFGPTKKKIKMNTGLDELIQHRTKLNSVALVRERTIPTEWPPPVGEVSANFCG